MDGSQPAQQIVDSQYPSFQRTAEQQIVPPTVSVSSQWLDQLFKRLDQQDAEIRLLHLNVGEVQSEVRDFPVVNRVPPVSTAQYSSPETLPASSASNDVIYQLQRRLDGVEQRMRPQTVSSTSNTADATGGSNPTTVKGYEFGTDTTLIPSWNNGLELKSKNGDFRLRLGGFVQYDIDWLDPESHLEAPPAVGGIGRDPNSTQIRRGRITFDGTFYEVFDFRVEFDLANESRRLQRRRGNRSLIHPPSPTSGCNGRTSRCLEQSASVIKKRPWDWNT